MDNKYEQLLGEFENAYIDLCNKYGVVLRVCPQTGKLYYDGMRSDDITDVYFDEEIA